MAMSTCLGKISRRSDKHLIEIAEHNGKYSPCNYWVALDLFLKSRIETNGNAGYDSHPHWFNMTSIHCPKLCTQVAMHHQPMLKEE